MYLAYLDESGDPGVVNSPTTFFVVGCVLVHDSKWLETLDGLISMRQSLRDKFGIRTRAELKASAFKSNRGELRRLQWDVDRRMRLFKGLLTYQRRLPIRVFAVAIEKAAAVEHDYEPRRAAWKFVLQRLHTFCHKLKTDERVMVFPDEGHGYFIRRLLREVRRHHSVPALWGPGTFTYPLDRIVEDPNERESHNSYLAQLADWVAYAAHRSRHVAPAAHVPDDAWDEFERAQDEWGDPKLVRAVNRNTGGPPGIVKWPR